jgi:acyl-coenzyme A thioesterase PaaI-like protein
MNVRFLQPSTPGIKLTAVGRLVENRRGRIFEAGGELRTPAGTVVATATGKYLPIRDEEARGMAGDFVGDTRSLFDEPPPTGA